VATARGIERDEPEEPAPLLRSPLDRLSDE